MQKFSHLWTYVQLWAHLWGEDKPVSAWGSQRADSRTTAADLLGREDQDIGLGDHKTSEAI